jgi:hypothetical protein
LGLFLLLCCGEPLNKVNAFSRHADKQSIIVKSTPSTTGTTGDPSTYSVDVCLTQALIDKYGAPLPHISGDCHITRLDKKANSMSAEMVCSGATIGKATMQSSWTADRATGSVHFVGTAPKP